MALPRPNHSLPNRNTIEQCISVSTVLGCYVLVNVLFFKYWKIINGSAAALLICGCGTYGYLRHKTDEILDTSSDDSDTDNMITPQVNHDDQLSSCRTDTF